MEIEKIFKTLDLQRDNGLYIIKENKWKGILAQRVENILETIIKPHAFFLFNDEPIILFFRSPDHKEDIFRYCWNFNQSPIIFILNDSVIEIYNGLSFDKEDNQAELLPNDNWQIDFSYFNIISGKTWEKYRKELSFEKRVDEKLLRNIEAVRDLQIKKHNLPSQITNNLIGRLIFIRYLDDSVVLYEKYWKDRERDETKQQKKINSDFNGKIEIKVSRKEIAQVFLIRVSDFQFDECAFVVTSKVLYNLKAKVFRKYFLNNFAVRKVFEMSSMRHEIFDKSNDPSSCPASILYYSYSPDKEKNKQNLVTHISLKPNRFFEIFRMFVVEKHDQKQLFQHYFMKYDWIWKVLVYGNLLDFYLIKRIKEYQNITNVISDENKFLFGQGIMVGGGDKNPVFELVGKLFIDTRMKDLKQFFVRIRNYQISDQEKALIDYAHKVSIPLIRERRYKQRIYSTLNLQNQTHKDYLSVYAKIFTNHYNQIFNSDGHYFEVEVWHSDYMIGMYFKVISEPSLAENQIIWKRDKNTDDLLKKFIALSMSNQSQNLFIQKNIKGFEKSAFYIVKPNEYKCWHRAVAYLDLNEFIDAIMKSAKRMDQV